MEIITEGDQSEDDKFIQVASFLLISFFTVARIASILDMTANSIY